MKRGVDLNIRIIKTTAKEGTAKIQSLHYKINDILYKYSKRYIAPMTAKRLFYELGALGKELKELEVTDRTKPKKEELLTCLRSICSNLKEYSKNYEWKESDENEVIATINFKVSEYIRNKESLDIVEMLKDNKQIWNEMYLQNPYRIHIKTNKFIDMQNELLERFYQLYKIN